MPDPVTFRHPALTRAYANAERSMARLPEAERTERLADLATRLTTLDARTDLSEADLGREAARLVTTALPSGPAGGPTPERPGRTTLPGPGQIRRLIATPGITLDASDGMPLIDGKRPQNWSELGDALYDMASVIDRTSRGNTLQRLGVTQRAALVDRLVAAVDGTDQISHPPHSAESTLTQDQQTQLRASAAAILSEVVGSLTAEESPAGRLLLERTLRTAAKLARDESHPILRDSMVFGLYRHQTKLPRELRPITQQLMREGPHLTPPYDAWLADGKIGVDMVIDGAAATLDGTVKDLERQGFTRVGRSNPPLMRATLGNGDKEAVVEVRIRVKSDNIFDKINDSDVDIVWYSGHSSYGRNFPRSLEDTRGGSGNNKLVVFDTCFGKDNMQHVRQKFPGAELLSTFRSSTYSDSMNAMRAMWDGIGGRKSWAGIGRRLGGPERGNWVTPADTMLRRRILDADGDGRADALDKLFDVNLQHVEHDMRRAFQPNNDVAPLHRLQNVYAVISANWLNRGAGGYNESIRDVVDYKRVSSGGYFDGGPGDPPVRIASVTYPDGETGWTVSINRRFAHMPEEVLRVVATFEVNQYLAQNAPSFDFYQKPLEAKINGLMAVAFTLSHDLTYNDREVWKGFLEAYRLPSNLDLHELERFAGRHANSWNDNDAGSKAAVRDYVEHLTNNEPDLKAKLEAPTAGTWPRPSSPSDAGLPDVLLRIGDAKVEHGVDGGDYYCEHAFFLIQREAQRNDSSVLANEQGEKLVGFLHVPGDRYTEIADPNGTAYQQADRHADLRQVIGAAFGGYVNDMAGQVDDGPMRILLTGYGPFGSAVNNPTQDFVSHPSNIDAAMKHAFGDDLLTAEGSVEGNPPRSPFVVTYRIRDPQTGEQREVKIQCGILPVDDNALDPDQAGSLQGMMRSFKPHGVISLGVAQSLHNTFLAERHADSGGLSLGNPPTHSWNATADVEFPDNYALARAISGGTR